MAESAFMKKRIYPWILASAYVLFGMGLNHIIPKFQEMYSGFDIKLSFLTRVMISAGPFGRLGFPALMGVVVILTDNKFHSRYLNHIFAVILLLGVWCALGALILPPAGGLTNAVP